MSQSLRQTQWYATYSYVADFLLLKENQKINLVEISVILQAMKELKPNKPRFVVLFNQLLMVFNDFTVFLMS